MRATRPRRAWPRRSPLRPLAVVFGEVIDGMDVVEAIETFGSQAGKTAKPVIIADCGQIA